MNHNACRLIYGTQHYSYERQIRLWIRDVLGWKYLQRLWRNQFPYFYLFWKPHTIIFDSVAQCSGDIWNVSLELHGQRLGHMNGFIHKHRKIWLMLQFIDGYGVLESRFLLSYHIEAGTKWRPFRRRHFKRIFMNQKVPILTKTSLKFVLRVQLTITQHWFT